MWNYELIFTKFFLVNLFFACANFGKLAESNLDYIYGLYTSSENGLHTIQIVPFVIHHSLHLKIQGVQGSSMNLCKNP